MLELRRLIGYFLPQWKAISRQQIECTHVSPLLGGREWTTTDVLEIQENTLGDKRAFIVTEHGRKKVDYNYIMTILNTTN